MNKKSIVRRTDAERAGREGQSGTDGEMMGRWRPNF